MTNNRSRLSNAVHLLDQLRRGQAGARYPMTEPRLDPQLALLRAWQTDRLARTHADLLASPRYGPACRFFLSDLYAPRDFSQRDQDFEQLHRFLQRYLPAPLLRVLTRAIEANTLTKELDEILLAVLVNDLEMMDAISPQMYCEAYRRGDNYDKRVRQIELIVEVGREIDRIVRLPLSGIVLRLARRPAQRAAWTEIQDFLERGYAAFKHMGGADTFLYTLYQREKQILDRIFAGDSDPFTDSGE